MKINLLPLLIGCLCALLISRCAQACPNVTKVSVGNPAPCTGWHVSEPQMQVFAKQTDQLQLSQDLNKVNEQLLKLSDREIEFYKSKVKSQSKELEKAETKRFLSSTGAFILGVVITGVAAKVAIEATK